MPPPLLDVLLIANSQSETLQELLAAMFPALRTAHSLQTGLVAATAPSPDLILLDLSSPDTAGELAALMRFRAEVPEVPVLVLADDPEVSMSVMRLGAADCLARTGLSTVLLQRTIRHILERRRLLSHLQQSHSSFSSIVERSPDGVLVVSEGVIRYANPAAASALGRQRSALIGEPSPWSVAVGSTEEVPLADARHGEVRVSKTTWNGAPAVLQLVRDITRRKAAELALREQEQHVERVRRMEAIGLLAGGVAHEFNNLLMVIQGFTELAMVQRHNPVRVAEHLSQVHLSARRAADITTQLMRLSRHSSETPRRVYLAPLLEEARRLLTPLLGERIDLSVVTEDPAATVQVDPGEVHQAIMNLAINARDAMPGGGHLVLRLEAASALPAGERGDWVVLSVVDSGVGMDAQTLAHALEPFFTTKEVGKGTGLGLATVFGLAQGWGAHLHLTSATNKGTTASLFFPRFTGHEPDASPAPARVASSATRSGTETILVVEDDEGVRALLQKILTRHGYTVLEAATTDRARQLASQADLLLLDVVMPDGSGAALRSDLLRGGIAVPMMLMSGYPSQRIADELPDGVSVMRKPLDAQTVLAAVRAALDEP